MGAFHDINPSGSSAGLPVVPDVPALASQFVSLMQPRVIVKDTVAKPSD